MAHQCTCTYLKIDKNILNMYISKTSFHKMSCLILTISDMALFARTMHRELSRATTLHRYMYYVHVSVHLILYIWGLNGHSALARELTVMSNQMPNGFPAITNLHSTIMDQPSHK